jgi:hypothetical protein
VRFIRDYFSARDLDLSPCEPDTVLVRDADGRTGAQAPRAMRRGSEEWLIYHPNANSADRAARVDATKPARLRLDLTGAPGRFTVEWFRPYDGVTAVAPALPGGRVVELTAPWPGHDAVLWLRKE